MNEQIEEMRETIHAEIRKAVVSGLVTWAEFAKYLAEALYNAGYRKQEQGVWIFEHEFYGKMLCSNCKEEALVNECNEYVDSDFCPTCGAKMKGEQQ